MMTSNDMSDATDRMMTMPRMAMIRSGSEERCCDAGSQVDHTGRPGRLLHYTGN